MTTSTRPLRLGLAAALLLGSALVVQAAEIPRTVDPLPANVSGDQLRLALQQLGFSEVGTVAHQGNVYSVQAKWEGRHVDLRVDGRNGGILDRLAGGAAIGYVQGTTDAELRAALGRLGYSDVGAIEREGNVISVMAMRDGRPVDLDIDARNGGVAERMAGNDTIGQPKPNMSLADMKLQLAPLGYADASNLQEEGNVYSLDALKDGRWVKLSVNASHGGVQVLK